ncbi:MAG: hypothetical protein ABW249_02060 [Solirubrobacterales bacterium]
MRGLRWAVGALCASFALALIGPANAAAAVPRSFFGIMPQGGLGSDDYERMGDARVGTLRFEIFWAGIDPSPGAGDTDWTGPDAVVANAARNGVAALPFISSAPPWALELDGRDCDLHECPAYAPRGSRALAAWRGFLAEAVGRYGPGGEFWELNPTVPERPIRAWQIWNEQNSPSFWKPKPDVKAYARLLDASHAAITGEDPGAEIILGGMFGTPLGGRRPALAAWDYLAKLYRQRGAKRDFDGVAPHPYASKLDRVLVQIEQLRDEMVKANDGDAELWITELGWASGGAPNPLNRGLAGQADRLSEAFRYFVNKRRRLNVALLTWYSWRDNSATDAGLCEWCPDSGLLREDGSAKPAYATYTRFTGGS